MTSPEEMDKLAAVMEQRARFLVGEDGLRRLAATFPASYAPGLKLAEEFCQKMARG